MECARRRGLRVEVEGAARERHMRRAIEVAKVNPDAPFGYMIADAETDEVVAEGLNDAEKSPILHGETAAIRTSPRIV